MMSELKKDRKSKKDKEKAKDSFSPGSLIGKWAKVVDTSKKAEHERYVQRRVRVCCSTDLVSIISCAFDDDRNQQYLSSKLLPGLELCSNELMKFIIELKCSKKPMRRDTCCRV